MDAQAHTHTDTHAHTHTFRIKKKINRYSIGLLWTFANKCLVPENTGEGKCDCGESCKGLALWNQYTAPQTPDGGWRLFHSLFVAPWVLIPQVQNNMSNDLTRCSHRFVSLSLCLSPLPCRSIPILLSVSLYLFLSLSLTRTHSLSVFLPLALCLSLSLISSESK